LLEQRGRVVDKLRSARAHLQALDAQLTALIP
jgi:hypothetical protein